MNETHPPIEPSAGRVLVSESDTRQGKTGMGVRYVLVISLGAAVVLLAAVYAIFGF